MSRAQKRNNVLAGLFLVSALLLAVVMSFWIEDGLARLPFVNPKATYAVRFTLGDGVAGLKPGSPVTLGGKEIGSVESIEYVTETVRAAGGGERTRATGVTVTIEVDRELALYEDATVRVVSPLLGTLSSVNIADPGGNGGGEPLADAGEIVGRSPAGLASIEGLSTQIGDFVNNADALVRDLAPKLDGIDPIMANLDATLAHTASFTEGIGSRQEGWFNSAQSILANANAVFEETLPAAAAEVVAGVGDGRRLLSTAQDMIDENRADLRRAVGNLEGVTTRVRYDVLGRVERVLDEGVIAAANMGDVGSRVLATLDRVEPPLSRTLTNAQLASEQAVVLIEEVRAAPWRLLEAPDEKTQREVVLASAVRRYATAVERLRDVSESLDSVLRGARLGGRDVSAEQVMQMNEAIKSSFADYRDAEGALLGLISREAGGE